MRKLRFWLYERRGVFYLHDSETGRRESLQTRSRREAEQIRFARNQAAAQPQVGWALARACLAAQDRRLPERTWGQVMEEFCQRGKPQTQLRRRRTIRSDPLCRLKQKRLIETTADDFLEVLRGGGVMTQATLRCLQNLAVGMGWLPWPVLPNKLWPAGRSKKKRGVTWEEHQRIVQAEQNLEHRRYYQLLWETGASQTDAALLRAENVDWPTRVLVYQRQKTGEMAHLRVGGQLESLLRQLPSRGLLFPKLARTTNAARSSEFCRRCRLLGIRGVSLHSYRYAWAERAKSCGYPERWAQSALGHNSPAVHQAYARQGIAVCPPLEDYEQSFKEKVVPMASLPVDPAAPPSALKGAP